MLRVKYTLQVGSNLEQKKKKKKKQRERLTNIDFNLFKDTLNAFRDFKNNQNDVRETVF